MHPSPPNQAHSQPNKAFQFWFDVERLWSLTLGSPEIKIAILDTATDLRHECLDGAKLTVFSEPGQSPAGSAHGTAVTSLIFGRHGSPVRGLAPACSGLLIPIYDEPETGGEYRTTQQRLAYAILLALENGATIINISGGELARDSIAGEFLESAIKACAERGVLVIAAAGNNACRCIHLPAALPSVLAVGAMDEDGEPLPSSNWGAEYAANGILAPGQNITAAIPGNSYSPFSGTSFAAPLLAGAAALLASLQLRQSGRVNLVEIREAILQSATPCGTSDPVCERILAGRIDLARAHHLLFGPSSSNLPHPETSIINIKPNHDHPMDTTCPVPAILPSCEPTTPLAAPVQPPPLPVSESAPAIQPSDCGCGCGGKSAAAPAPQLCYALGRIDYDFGSEARRDSLQQASDDEDHSLSDTKALIAFLRKNPEDATALNWTLNVDETPVYVLRPAGAYADRVYERLIEQLEEQLNGVERISVPGYLPGASVRLLTGETVPVLIPELRGMFSWSTKDLVDATAGAKPARDAKKSDQDAYTQKIADIRNFLDRIYYELRNLGVTSSERALNYAATNAYQVESVLEESRKDDLELETIAVEKSPICRQHSDCWDVKLTFFHPKKLNEIARKVHRFTVDVSDVVPVTVGPVRSWSIY